MASFQEIKDLNLFSYNIGIINDDVLFLLYLSYISQNLDLPIVIAFALRWSYSWVSCGSRVSFFAFFFERLYFLRHFECVIRHMREDYRTPRGFRWWISNCFLCMSTNTTFNRRLALGCLPWEQLYFNGCGLIAFVDYFQSLELPSIIVWNRW